MRSLAILGAALAVFLLGSSIGAAARGPTRLVLEVKPVSSRPTDKPPKGPSAGDQVVETTKLVNVLPQLGEATGAVVGHDRSTMVLTSPTSATVKGVAYLPGGTLVFSGRIKPDPRRGGFTIAVTRGTGRFAGVRGQLWVYSTSKPVKVFNVYTLRYPATA